MKEIKNANLIKEFIRGIIYSINYDLLMHTLNMKVIVHNEGSSIVKPKIYEINLNLADEIKYKVLDTHFKVAILKEFKIEESKYKNSYGEEFEIYQANLKIWEDKLEVKCKSIDITLIYEDE